MVHFHQDKGKLSKSEISLEKNMGRNNQNSGMHFMHHTSKVSEADAIAYLERKELKKVQDATKQKFDEVSKKYDKPCHLKLDDMKTKIHVNYYDESYIFECPMYRYNILNAKNKENKKLTLWVGYDLGGENYETGENEKRGYYFYFSVNFKRNITNRKILLFEVSRQSKLYMSQAIHLASLFGKEIVSSYCDNLEIDWDNPAFERYGHMSIWMNMSRIRCFRTIKNCTLEW